MELPFITANWSGLIPQEALIDAAVWYTQLDQFSTEQILESRLYQSGDSRSKESDASFLDDLAAATAAPGGGSAAAYAGAIGAALVAMVAGLTIGKKKYCRGRSRDASRSACRPKSCEKS